VNGESSFEWQAPVKTDWDVEIPMDDGLVLKADVYRPDDGQHPVILSYGPYAKGLAFQ